MAWTLVAENIAGIRAARTEIRPGKNVVRGANWKGKSSFLQAIETAMGTKAPLTEGASAGYVELEMEDGEYRVELERRNGTVIEEGTPYLTDEYDRICAEIGRAHV